MFTLHGKGHYLNVFIVINKLILRLKDNINVITWAFIIKLNAKRMSERSEALQGLQSLLPTWGWKGQYRKHKKEMVLEVNSSPRVSSKKCSLAYTLNFGLERPQAENLAELFCAWSADPWKSWDNNKLVLFVVICFNSSRILMHHPSVFMVISFLSFGSQLKCHMSKGPMLTILLKMSLLPLSLLLSSSALVVCFHNNLHHISSYFILLFYLTFNTIPMRTGIFVHCCNSGHRRVNEWILSTYFVPGAMLCTWSLFHWILTISTHIRHCYFLYFIDGAQSG